MYGHDELNEMLTGDCRHPDTLYKKSYLNQKFITREGDDSIFWISSWLLGHLSLLRRSRTNWGTYKTFLTSASLNRRSIKEIMEEPFFNQGEPVPLKITVTDDSGNETGHFDFLTIQRNGKNAAVSLVSMTEKNRNCETSLSQTLYYWMLLHSVDFDKIKKEFSISGALSASAVILNTEADNEIYSAPPKQSLPRPLMQLSLFLRVFRRNLFQGTFVRPYTGMQWIDGRMTEKELVSCLRTDSLHGESLYQKNYINDEGLCADTGKPYVEVISDWFCNHPDICIPTHEGAYGFLDQMSCDKAEKNLPFAALRKQKCLPPFGRIIPRGFVFLGSRGQRTGLPSLLVYDKDVTPGRGYSLLRMIELPDQSDSLLRIVLKVHIHISMIDRGKLAADLKLPEGTTVEARILSPAAGHQYELFQRDWPYVKKLMDVWNISLIILHKGLEAMA